MKAKITTILAGQIPNDNDYARAVYDLPDIIDEQNLHLCYYPRNSATIQENRLSAQIRAAAKKYQWGDWKQKEAEDNPSEEPMSTYGYRRRHAEGDSRAEDDESVEYAETDDEDDGQDDPGDIDDLDHQNENNATLLLDPLLTDPQVSGRVSEAMRELRNIDMNNSNITQAESSDEE